MDTPDASKNLADKIASDGKGKISFPLLSDPDHKTIDAYGLRDPAYKGKDIDGIPHPAVYIIDKDGKVKWAKIESDYRKRPTNAEVRAVLNTVKEIAAAQPLFHSLRQLSIFPTAALDSAIIDSCLFERYVLLQEIGQFPSTIWNSRLNRSAAASNPV